MAYIAPWAVMDSYQLALAIQDRIGTMIAEDEKASNQGRLRARIKDFLKFCYEQDSSSYSQAKGSVAAIALRYGIPEHNNDTLLHYASGMGYLGVMKLLMENGAHKEIPNASGETPMISAAKLGPLTAVELLYKEGAKASPRDTDGNTARLYLAKRFKDTPLAEMLRIREIEELNEARRALGISEETSGLAIEPNEGTKKTGPIPNQKLLPEPPLGQVLDARDAPVPYVMSDYGREELKKWGIDTQSRVLTEYPRKQWKIWSEEEKTWVDAAKKEKAFRGGKDEGGNAR